MNKWFASFYATLLFLLIASPIMFSITQKTIGSLSGIRISNNGCPTMLGLIIHAVVFFVIIRLLLALKNTTENYVPKLGYDGLASPGSMMRCNTFRLMAENANSQTCSNAATTCLTNPFAPECHAAITACDQSNSELAKYSDMCRIHNFPEWQNRLNSH